MHRKISFLLMMTIVGLMIFGCSDQNPIDPKSDVQVEGPVDLMTLFADKGLVIESATLNLYVLLANYKQIDIKRITKPWDEATETFNTFGSGFAPETFGSFNAEAYGWNKIDVTNLVQGWLHRSYENFGLGLVSGDPLAEKCRIGTHENPWNTHPYIEVAYNTPEGLKTAILPGIADTFIWEGNPDGIYGLQEYMYVGLDDDAVLQKDGMMIFDTTSLPETAILGDFVWNDINQDGVQDIDEPGLADVVVNLYDCTGTLLLTTVTDIDGSYLFVDLMPGDYFIGIEEPADYFNSPLNIGAADLDSDIDPSTGISACVSVAFGDKILDLDVGLYQEQKVDCGECDGKVSQLTIRYNGTEPMDLTVIDERKYKVEMTMFDGVVESGDFFSLEGLHKHDTMGAEISFWSGGVRLYKLHTSCSVPIGPGMIFGDFEIMDGFSRRGGPLCPLDMVIPDCNECDGKVTQLTLRYLGEDPTHIRAYDGNKQRENRLMFEGDLYTGDEVTLNGTGRHDDMRGQISLWTEFNRATKIHTSCSEPIGPGMIFGDYEVVEGFSRHGGKLCPVEYVPPAEGDAWCEDGKPSSLTMLYTGQDCGYSNHAQDPCAVQCYGDPEFTPTVRIVVSSKESPSDRKNVKWFDGDVALDSTFQVMAANAGELTLGAKTFVRIYAPDGTLLQFLEFHTSCSQPLNENDQFGSIRLVGFSN